MVDYAMMWTLAHEYINSAHKIAALLASGKSNDYACYYQVVASAIRCLQAALLVQCSTLRVMYTNAMQESQVPDEDRLKIMLSLGRILYLETANWKEAEVLLQAAITLANTRQALVEYKFMACILLAQILRDMSPKAATRALDDGLQDARLVKSQYWEYMFRLHKGRHGLDDLRQLAQDAELVDYIALSENTPSSTTTHPFHVLRLCQQALRLFVQGDTQEAIRVLHELHSLLDNMPESTAPLHYLQCPPTQEIFAFACLLSGIVHMPDSCTVKAERFLAEGLRIVENMRSAVTSEPLYLAERDERRTMLDRLASYLLFYLSVAQHTRSNHDAAQELEQQLTTLSQHIKVDPFITSGMHFLHALRAHYAKDYPLAIQQYELVDQGDLYIQAQMCLRQIRPTQVQTPAPSEQQLKIGLELEQALASRELLQSRTLLGNIISTSSKHLNNTFRVIALNLLSLQYLDANPEQAGKMALAANALAKKEQNVEWIAREFCHSR